MKMRTTTYNNSLRTANDKLPLISEINAELSKDSESQKL